MFGRRRSHALRRGWVVWRRFRAAVDIVRLSPPLSARRGTVVTSAAWPESSGEGHVLPASPTASSGHNRAGEPPDICSDLGVTLVLLVLLELTDSSSGVTATGVGTPQQPHPSDIGAGVSLECRLCVLPRR